MLFGVSDQDPNVGCRQLMARVRQVKPKLHCFGHIHVSRGREVHGDTTFINAANGGRHMPMGAKLSFEQVKKTRFRTDPMAFDIET